jgi:hypothetical protein
MKTRPLVLACVLLALPATLNSAVLSLVNHNDLWQYRKGTNAPQANWKSIGASLDSTWLSGLGGFGFGTTAAETNACGTILTDMKGTAATNYTTLYMRKVFNVSAGFATNLHLFLRTDWDDGYIAWLDGVYLADNSSPGAPNEPAFNALASNAASGGHESSGGQGTTNPAVTNDLGAVGLRLSPGEHVLTIIGLNMSQTSGDFVQVADLFLDTVAEPPAVTNPVGGTIALDTTWYATNSFYTVTGSVTVLSNVTLTIEPGVTVWSRQGCGFNVYGRLLAEGTTNQPITFTRFPTDATWERIMFLKAADSRFRYCTFEFANCVGDHKAYYATNCSFPFAVGPRTYFEAVVALGSHLDLENCVFRNLPSAATHGEGDALAIISDDLVYHGPASADIRGCQFLNIGQGINTRYAYVLVENCYFVGKYGDNDDVELYGEGAYYGLPAPIVRNNLFDMPCYDDRIHPTKCSAIIYGNQILGSGDHAIVLRDKCTPVVFNNVMYNCPSGGITIQNQCDALLMNNTIINCGPGLKLFDHTDRWGTPYCLTPGSGKATAVNCIVWNNTAGWDLAESPYTGDRGSHLAIYYSNVQSNGNISANSTLAWGPGNLSSNPGFVSMAGYNLRLAAGSPCIDAGTNAGTFVATNLLGVVTNFLALFVTNDLDRMPRPLDGNADAVSRMDMGAFELLSPMADSNGDGIPDGWCVRYGFNPIDPAIAGADPDRDLCTTREEYVADTNPTNALSCFHIEAISNGPPTTIQLLSSPIRQYTLLASPRLDGAWVPLAGQVHVAGNGGWLFLSDTNISGQSFYRVSVSVP